MHHLTFVRCAVIIATLAACTPTPSPSTPMSAGPLTKQLLASDTSFSTWQEAANFGGVKLTQLVDDTIGQGTGVNADSLRVATARFGMPRRRVDFMRLVNCDIEKPFDDVVANDISVCGVMMKVTQAAAVIEVKEKDGVGWRVRTMGDQRITRRVNAAFTFVPANQVDSLVMYDVMNLHASVIKVKNSDGWTFYTAFGSPSGAMQQFTELAVLQLLKTAAVNFNAVHGVKLATDSFSG